MTDNLSTEEIRELVERLKDAGRQEAETGLNYDVAAEDGRVILTANDMRLAATALTRLQAELEEVKGERDEALKDRNAHAEHVLRVAREAEDGFAALEEAERCWDASSYPSNRSALTLSEQVSSIIRERDAAEARATQAEQAQDREITALREALELIVREADDISRYTTLEGDHVIRPHHLTKARTALSTNHKTGEV